MRNVTLADWKPTKRQKQLVNKVLESGRLTYGPMTQKFEEEFARLHNRKYAIFTNSGTSALQVSLHYLKAKYGWKDGDEVLVPAVTFVATVNVILQNNLKPVLVDVDIATYNVDPRLIEEKITKKTRAIMPVHLLGQPAQMDKIMRIAKKHKLKVVEDSCETMFVKFKGKPVGSQGDIACFSSYLAHIISTGVGGFITTNDKEAHDYMRSLIWHGRDNMYLNIDANNTKNKKALIHARFKFDKSGYSYRATELEAALGIDELARAKQIIKSRQENAEYLFNKLEPLEAVGYISLPTIADGAEHAWMFFPILVRNHSDRDKLALFLEERGVQTRWIMPLTNQPVYASWLKQKDYPRADIVNRFGILLGCHHLLVKKDLKYLVECIEAYFYDRS